MKSEVQGTVGGSREGLTLVGAERHSRFDQGDAALKVEDRLKHQVTPSVTGLSVDSSSSGLVVRLVAHCHPHLKLHMRRASKSN